MYKNHMMLMKELGDYASPKAKLTRMISSGEVLQIKRGLFLDAKDKTYSAKSLAAIIYGPSYISFEYALGYYGLIPERVTAIISAVYNKNKNRNFHTPVGDFYYHYLPTAVYPYCVIQMQEEGQSFLIASPEKALCDTLYKVKGVTSFKALNSLLLNNWRIEKESLLTLDQESIFFLAPLYRKKILLLFADWLKKGGQ